MGGNEESTPPPDVLILKSLLGAEMGVQGGGDLGGPCWRKVRAALGKNLLIRRPAAT